MERCRSLRPMARVLKLRQDCPEFWRLFSEFARAYKRIVGSRYRDAPFYCLFQMNRGFVHTAEACERAGQPHPGYGMISVDPERLLEERQRHLPLVKRIVGIAQGAKRFHQIRLQVQGVLKVLDRRRKFADLQIGLAEAKMVVRILRILCQRPSEIPQ